MALEELQSGRYHRLRLLGTGGMGEVYLMQDQRVTRQVAIKVIRSENSPSLDRDAAASAARLFQREAKAIAALEHPNILPLYDFGEEISEGSTVSYMVMPFCADGSLSSWLSQRTASSLSPQDVAYLIEQAAEGLQYAHDHEVIHLDVKPSNFLLRGNKKNPNRPTVLLADFGIARSSTTVANTSRTIRGTPTAMAPEQWTSSPVPATDQYALAVMTYEMLTGRAPFVGSMEQLMYQHFSVQPPPPSKFNPRLPAALDPVLVRALAKEPADRFPSISAFASALQDAASSATASPVTQEPGIDTYTTLAITKAEADAGISRMVTLPGGGKVNVPIPAGAQDGQLITVSSSDEASTLSSPLVLSIAITPSDDVHISDKSVPSKQQQPITPQLFEPISGHDLPTMATTPSPLQVAGQQSQPPLQKKPAPFRLGIVSILVVLLIMVLVGSGLFYFSTLRPGTQQLGASAVNHSNTAVTQATVQRPTPTPTIAVTPTAAPKDGLYIPGTYKGTMVNDLTNQTTAITVFLVETKGNGSLTGSVTYPATQTVDLLTGTVDLQGNFSFSIPQPSGQKPLLFVGAVQQQQGNFLKGNFCSSTTNTCLSQSGYFYVGPGY